MSTTTTAPRTIPAPTQYPDNAPYWGALAEGRLMLRHCRSCGKPHCYPRPVCPFCLGDASDWRAAQGQGAIYSFSVCRRVGPVPYVIAYVRLDEGVTMLTNIVDCDFDAIRIGDRVRLVPKPAEDGTMVAMFTPA
ncbi:OB-fold domain-containing protein [Comamonadaceae bacterium G21597-S1]|nr:OB-fold domain-containing protein [Comamonadaceae bacterium G21597-S1]